MSNKIVTRAYNSWKIDSLRGVVEKSSTNSKLQDEIRYYEILPKEFSVFFPRLVAVDASAKIMSLEKYDYPNLGEYITGGLTVSDWDIVMQKLQRILKLWQGFPGKNTNVMPNSKDAEVMFVEKTIREYEAFKQQGIWTEYLESGSITINGVPYDNFKQIWPKVEKYLREVIIPSYKLAFIHGDFCLCNMLYGTNGTLRFIDPRGSFGSEKNKGDQRYDVAKIAHSVDGGYEFCNNNQFELTKIGTHNWHYRFTESTTSKDLANQAFEKTFYEGENAFSKKEIKLIEGLIFLGHCARHYENADRQLVLYLIGIEKLNEFVAL